jgi:hypothetical protein
MHRGYTHIRIGERLSGSGSLIVTMMQPTESLVRHDTTGGDATSSVVRRSLPEPKVRAVFVVLADVFREQSFQMAFTAMI